MIANSELMLPIFTLIGIFLGWFLSFVTDLLKLKFDKEKNKRLLLIEKIEKAVSLLFQVQKQQFELQLKLLNKVINNQEIILENTEAFMFELKSLVYLYLPENKN